jgi:hypothetical protein
MGFVWALLSPAKYLDPFFFFFFGRLASRSFVGWHHDLLYVGDPGNTLDDFFVRQEIGGAKNLPNSDEQNTSQDDSCSHSRSRSECKILHMQPFLLQEMSDGPASYFLFPFGYAFSFGDN